MMRISRVHYPVTVLGPGRRVGIWVQGCRNRCPGCISRDTWDPTGGTAVDEGELASRCRTLARVGVDGITITGGEPFEQPEALAALLNALQEWRDAENLDVLCYSGWPLGRLELAFPDLLARLDAIIPEPYIESLPTEAIWRGSANQPLVLLSPLARLRCGAPEAAGPTIQFVLSEHGVWFIGIPGRGDMERLRRVSAKRGLLLESVSWA